MRQIVRLIPATAFFLAAGWADFSYQQTSKITGGSMVRLMKMVPGGGKALQPATSTIAVKGNRMVSASEKSLHIIDLDKEIMIEADLEKKEYSTITFAEFKQVLAALSKKMNQEPGAEISMKVDVKETGQTKRIQDLDTREFLMTLEIDMKDTKSEQSAKMVLDNDVWLAADVPGYQEAQEFYVRLSEKLGWNPEMARMGQAAMLQPGMGEGMAKLMKEGAKLKGVPIYQVTNMKGAGGAYEAMGQMPGTGGGPTPDLGEAARRETEREARDEAGSQTARAAGGRFGGLAGAAAAGAVGGLFGKKKPKEQPKQEVETPAQKQAPAAGAAPSSLMELTIESSNFSSASVDAAKFSIPAGYKEVEHPMKKMAKETR